MSGRVTRRVEQVMGLPFSLAMRGRHAAGGRADAAWGEALAVLREADRVFSTYRDDSVVNRLERGEVGLDDLTDTERQAVREVLDLGEAMRVASHGAFDVRRPEPGPDGPGGRLRLDPSGVVKGWAAQRAAAALLALPETDVCLGAGGDVLCHVSDPHGEPWSIGIEHPLDPSRLVATLPVRRGAVATSGLAHRGAHVTDPRPGRPRVPRGLASVTVVDDHLTCADLDATAALVLGPDEAPAWLRSRGRIAVLVGQTGSVEVLERSLERSNGPVCVLTRTCG